MDWSQENMFKFWALSYGQETSKGLLIGGKDVIRFRLSCRKLREFINKGGRVLGLLSVEGWI